MTDKGGSVAALHAALLAADSATAVLEAFFGPVTVQRVGQRPPANEGLHDRLQLATGDVLRHRAVRLLADGKLLSRAELWYVANRLPAALVEKLETGSTPFGRIMQPVGLKRHVLVARACAPGEAASLEHRALLTRGDGRPVAEVYELYETSLFTES